MRPSLARRVACSFLVSIAVSACDESGRKPPEGVPDAGDSLDASTSDAGSTDAGSEDGGEPDFRARCAAFDHEAGITRPAGWDAASHCKFAPSDVNAVFPADKVEKLVLRLTADEYEVMQDDLRDLTGGGEWPDAGMPPPWDGGAFPEDAGTWVPPPDPGVVACEGKAKDDVCTFDWGDGPVPGTCQNVPWSEALSCYPDAWRSPRAWVEACEGKSEGEACSTAEHEGVCTSDGLEVACFPNDPGPGQNDPCKDKAVDEACTLASGATGVCLQTSGPKICQVDGFDEASVDDVPIEAAAAFWPREPRYVHATLEYLGKTYTNVGLRYKGNNGLSTAIGEKKPLRIKLDAWEDEHPEITDQRLFGFQDLSFSPNQTDGSQLRQVLSSETFRARGVPAPHASFAEVWLDTGDGERLLGLYAITELPDDQLAERVFGNDDGDMYKPDGRGAHFVSFIEGSMHPKTDSDFADVKAFVSALHASQTDRTAYRANLRSAFDIDAFARFLAVNQAIANWDTYGGLAHNFYLYRDTRSNALAFLPWDFDLSFGYGADLSLQAYDGRWPLIQAVARDVDFATVYRKELAEFGQTQLSSHAIEKRVDALAAMIRPFVEREEAVRPHTLEAFTAGIADMKSNLDAQEKAVREFGAGKSAGERAHLRALRSQLRRMPANQLLRTRALTRP